MISNLGLAIIFEIIFLDPSRKFCSVLMLHNIVLDLDSPSDH